MYHDEVFGDNIQLNISMIIFGQKLSEQIIFAQIIFAMLKPSMSRRWRWSNEAIADAVVKHTHARYLKSSTTVIMMIMMLIEI